MRWKLIKGFIKIVSFLRNDNFEKSREAWFLSFWFDAVSFIKNRKDWSEIIIRLGTLFGHINC